MDIRLYNTLSKQKEVFKPITQGKVGMYHCGPTVYDRAHIGNLRAYVFADVLRRVFEYNDYTVTQVINITDVGHLSGENNGDADQGEDKMTKALIREGKPLTLAAMREVGTQYFEAFVEDLKELHIELATAFPRASDTIQQDIEFIKLLETKGYTYATSDGLYFDTSKLATYGALGGVAGSNTELRARITTMTEKKNPRDFAVWKLSMTQHEQPSIGWDSPWGRGFPGWHIECSVMSRMNLGQPFDIHTGGIDHIPVHHNNEIAQSQAAYDAPLAHYWMHTEFVTIKNTKMAKSAGNYVTLDTLEAERISPLAYRYWLLTGHYRSPLNFTEAAVESAQKALIRLMATVSGYPQGGVIILEYKDRFVSYINDDLEIPRAIALVWDLIKDSNHTDADKRATILDFDRVFGLNMEALPYHDSSLQYLDTQDVPPEIQVLAEARHEARLQKEWDKADALRSEIQERGFDVIDVDGQFKIIAR